MLLSAWKKCKLGCNASIMAVPLGSRVFLLNCFAMLSAIHLVKGPPPPHLLAPVLLCVLNSAFQAGHVPTAVNAALVTPVFKRGNNCDTSKYRPVAVTEPVIRLYAGVLNARLVQFTEGQALRSPGQAGFRPRLSTLHPLFTLQRFVDSCTKAAQPLYCCFLDLRGAYDRVQRPLLWQALQRLGVHGHMLDALRSLYANTTVSMRVEGKTGLAVPSETGVRQGCPLSPTLFGLFLDGLHRFMLCIAQMRDLFLMGAAVCLTYNMLMMSICLRYHLKAFSASLHVPVPFVLPLAWL